MPRISRTMKVNSDIPTASMADIAFLLLIFFMATTIFKLEEGLPVHLPRAEAGQQVPREKTTHVWVMSAREITINDNLIAMTDIVPILVSRVAEDPTLLVGVNLDQAVPWEIAAEVIEQLKEASALNASFTIERDLGK